MPRFASADLQRVEEVFCRLGKDVTIALSYDDRFLGGECWRIAIRVDGGEGYGEGGSLADAARDLSVFPQAPR